MTTYTATQWGTRALQKAAIVAEDDTPTAALLSWATTVGGALFDECIGEGIRFPAGSSSVLPSEYYDAFPSLVAVALQPEVGLLSFADSEAAKVIIKNKLRGINWQQPNDSPAVGEYY